MDSSAEQIQMYRSDGNMNKLNATFSQLSEGMNITPESIMKQDSAPQFIHTD